VVESDKDAERDFKPPERSIARDHPDYCDMPLDERKAALLKDFAERFGSVPTDLPPKGEPGW
jgi:hypothetical protein